MGHGQRWFANIEVSRAPVGFITEYVIDCARAAVNRFGTTRANSLDMLDRILHSIGAVILFDAGSAYSCSDNGRAIFKAKS